MTPDTLVHVLRGWAERDPGFRALCWLDDRAEPAEELTYAQLEARARAIAVEISSRTRAGDRVLLLYPPGLEFISAFFGCLFAGRIAVPAYPPLRPRDQRRIGGIARSAAPALVLGTAEAFSTLEPLTEELPAFAAAHRLDTREVSTQLSEHWRPPAIDEHSVAFLQYTSGSTGAPRGVMVTHRNVLANERAIELAFRTDRGSTVVTWLPHFHDMGLVGTILQPLVIGSHNVLMAPATFLRDPLRWLRAISKFRARVSGGPNFAYELCALRAGRLSRDQPVDLGCWELAFVGAEPVRAATLDAFARAFEPFGFRRRAFFPCYGLAEATLYVSGTSFEQGATEVAYSPPHGPERTLVGAGVAGEGSTVLVVDPERRVCCDEGVEGEVWVHGPSVAGGYWHEPKSSEATFRATLHGRADTHFLRTGDLGVQIGNELLITGRSKDLIIVRGQNFYPQDIEPVVESVHPALRASCTAAFSYRDMEEERVAVVAEVARGRLDQSLDSLAQEIRVAVANELDLRLDAVVLITPQTLPKTSSGKVERATTRAEFLSGRLEVVVESYLSAKADDRSKNVLTRIG